MRTVAGRLVLTVGLAFSLLTGPTLRAQSGQSSESRASRAFETARRQGPTALRMFLFAMPKGADLHSHLSGAVYAETFLRDAAEDKLCVKVAALSLDREKHAPQCGPGEVSAASVPADEDLYDQLIDSFSMRSFVPTTGDSGHDHFFHTFDRFGGTDKSHMGEWLDEVASRAAAQNEQYLELMDTPNFGPAAALASRIGFDRNFGEYREKLLASGFRETIPPIRAALDEAEASRNAREHCGEAQARPACLVEIRFLYQVLRGMPPESVFAQILLGFELASVDSRVVGINLVQPEDGFIAMRDYRLQMEMIDALHSVYPKVHISLHAGELTEGLVPPAGLRFHIRSAVEQGHAERIGHGVDISYEDGSAELLHEMSQRHVMVEINLTSNDVILNVKGDDHPFLLYRRSGVPVALSTDDEGVSRIDLTHEYLRAATTYPLSYADLKQMARTSLEHSFLPGESLWERETPENLTRPVSACRGQMGNKTPERECAGLVHDSQKAQQQWELEHRFHVFESSF